MQAAECGCRDVFQTHAKQLLSYLNWLFPFLLAVVIIYNRFFYLPEPNSTHLGPLSQGDRVILSTMLAHLYVCKLYIV